jgi:hypothetical protein
MISKHFASIADALQFINLQPDPIIALHSVVNQAMLDDEYGFAHELLAFGKEQQDYKIEITRSEPRTIFRTVKGVGPEVMCRDHLESKWHERAGDIDFSNVRKGEPEYTVEITGRV